MRRSPPSGRRWAPGGALAVFFLSGLSAVFVLEACGRWGLGSPEALPLSEVAAMSSGVDRSRPFIRVIGTAQDGGLPHAACTGEHCRAAREDPSRRRFVASLAVVLPEAGKVFLIDATPDLRGQLDLLADVRFGAEGPPDRVDRAPVDGVMLTHAHLGHYTGLAFFGFEAVHTRGLPVYCTPKMAEYLRGNGPWEQLVRIGNLELREIEPGGRFDLGEGVSVTSLQVPHRDEYADTVAYRIAGPRRTVFYVPDTDSWDRWEKPLMEILEDVDFALLDGSFYSLDELPGRDLSSIGHPLITRTMDLLQPLVGSGSLEILFTHLNHSNPAVVPGGEARQEIERRGFRVAGEGEEIPL